MASEQHVDQPDLETKITNWVIDKVDMVRRMATDNAVLVLRGLVFGLVIAVLGVAALIIFVTIAIRMADAYLPIGNGVGDATWAAHLFVGALFSILGLGAWLSRRSSTRPLAIAGIVDLVIIVVIVCYGVFS
jgi:hypothetical protein